MVSHEVRPLLKALATFVVALLILAGPMAPRSPAAAQNEAIDSVAIVTPASRTNGGWDQQGVDNLVAVGEAIGVEVAVAENAGYDDITPILQDLADDGADLIFCHASGYATTCPEFAADTGIPVVVIENPGAIAEGIVSDIETQAQEAAFLAGIAAGQETKTGVVAVVVSGEPPTWNYMTVGFAEGLHSVRPDARLIYQVIGEAAYDDAPNAKRVTESVIAANADIVFGMGDGASFGMIQAINERNAAAPTAAPVRFMDVIGDKRNTDAGTWLLTSVLFDYTGAYTTLITAANDGTFGEVFAMTVANDGVRLLELPKGTPETTTAEIEQARLAIVAGELKVSAVPDAEGVERRLNELFPV